MGIFSRITDIVSSNIVHMLDQAEDPEKMVRLMIQEMEDTLVEVKSEAARFIADEKGLEREKLQLEREVMHWQDKAELAVNKDRDDLAKLALEEKAKRLSELENLTEHLAINQETQAKFKEDIAALQNKLNEARSKQKTIVDRKRAALAQLQARKSLQKVNRSHAMGKFEQFEKGLDRIEGQVEAMGLGRQSPVEEEFAKLERDDAVSNELAELKKKLGKQSNDREDS